MKYLEYKGELYFLDWYFKLCKLTLTTEGPIISIIEVAPVQCHCGSVGFKFDIGTRHDGEPYIGCEFCTGKA